MANEFVCVTCGWQESTHIHGGWALSEVERKEFLVPKPGCKMSHMDCDGYTPPDEELAAEKRSEESGGAHEGCH